MVTGLLKSNKGFLCVELYIPVFIASILILIGFFSFWRSVESNLNEGAKCLIDLINFVENSNSEIPNPENDKSIKTTEIDGKLTAECDMTSGGNNLLTNPRAVLTNGEWEITLETQNIDFLESEFTTKSLLRTTYIKISDNKIDIKQQKRFFFKYIIPVIPLLFWLFLVFIWKYMELFSNIHAIWVTPLVTSPPTIVLLCILMFAFRINHIEINKTGGELKKYNQYFSTKKTPNSRTL